MVGIVVSVLPYWLHGLGWAGAVAGLREDLGLSSRIHLMGRAVRLRPMLVVCLPGFVLTPLPYQLGRFWAAV
jgi:hypothetical protein